MGAFSKWPGAGAAGFGLLPNAIGRRQAFLTVVAAMNDSDACAFTFPRMQRCASGAVPTVQMRVLKASNTMKRCVFALSVVAAWGGSTPAQAWQLDHVETHYEGGEYRLALTATLDVPLPRVERVLRDYAHYSNLDARILEVRVLGTPAANQVQLFTRIHVCVSLLCRNVERVERVEERPGELLATVLPERSDAERGETHTVLLADGTRTRVQYTTFIVPKFWVPALFGRSLMLRALREGTVSLFQNVERRAAIETP